MSDKNHATPSLAEQVELLTKALTRERNAKRKLELKLEEKLQQSFDKNKAFFDAYEKANSRQVQLQFLASLTSDIYTLANIDEMFAHFLKNIAIFLEPCLCLVIEATPLENQVYGLDKQDKKLFKLEYLLDETVSDLTSLEEHNHWQRLESKSSITKELSSIFKYDTVLVFKLAFSAKRTRYLMLNINHYCYSNDFKQTLNTATKQFATAVKKQIAEIEVSYNYKKLKSTVAELKSTQAQLVHQEKMASLGQLSAGVAHEINNPLGYITSNLDVLKEYCQEYEQAIQQLEQDNSLPIKTSKALEYARKDINDLLQSCTNGLGRITDIVASLKAFSKKDEDLSTTININTILDSSIEIVWNQIKFHQISKRYTEQLPPINGNEGQLQQVFVNLLLNASQAITDKGELTLETHNDNNEVVVAISDNGCGMDNKTVQRLFEPFFTTKQQNGGTGLGLSVSYAILEKHQALVSVNSESGIGSTFTLRFPCL